MKNAFKNTHEALGLILAMLTLTTIGPPLLAAQRSIEEFLSRQGTYVAYDDTDFHFLGCDKAYYTDQLSPEHPRWLLAWWDPATNTGLIMDYAGEDATWLKQVHGIDLGTTCEGTVTETPRRDGRAEVSIVIHARNVLTWAVNPTIDFLTDPLVFGCRWPDLVENQETPFLALGECLFQIKFISSAPGAPLPDLAELFTCHGEDVLLCNFKGQAHGPLRAAFGVPDGTPGMVQTAQQNGLSAAASHANPNSILNRTLVQYGYAGLPGKILVQRVGK